MSSRVLRYLLLYLPPVAMLVGALLSPSRYRSGDPSQTAQRDLLIGLSIWWVMGLVAFLAVRAVVRGYRDPRGTESRGFEVSQKPVDERRGPRAH